MKKLVALAMGLLMLGLAGCGASGTHAASSSASTAPAIPPALSFTVKADSWDAETDEALIVQIEGIDDDGEQISEQYKAAPNTKYKTELKSGTYVLALASASPTRGTRLFKAEPSQFEYAGDADKHVVLGVELDTEAMTAAEEAAEKAAAEKAAAEKAAAEKKAAEEAAAAAAATQNASKAAEANSATNSASEMTVYIASSGNGTKYHSNPNCSRMKGTISLTVSQAKSKGYGPCSKCM